MVRVEEDKTVRWLVGSADAFALLSAAFSYPAEGLANALTDGSFAADVSAVLEDMGLSSQEAEGCSSRIAEAAREIPASELLDALRIDYTALYYGPGKFRKIYPYESVFKKRAISPHVRATAFLTKSTHDVEGFMKCYQALPDDARREPVDFFATELDFMRLLLTFCASAMASGECNETLADDTRCFFHRHVSDWIPDVFEKTRNACETHVYRELATFGLMILEHVEGRLCSDTK